MYSSQFSGKRATRSIVNAFSVAGFTPQTIAVSATTTGLKSVVSGALTANTLSTVLSLSDGAYVIPQFTIETVDATARTMRIVVTIDGVVAFDFTSASVAATGKGACLAGTCENNFPILQRAIESGKSLLVQVASSLTETGKFSFAYNYQKVI